MTAIFVFDTGYDSDISMDYPKLISEKWNLTAKFNCTTNLQAIYFYATTEKEKVQKCMYLFTGLLSGVGVVWLSCRNLTFSFTQHKLQHAGLVIRIQISYLSGRQGIPLFLCLWNAIHR